VHQYPALRVGNVLRCCQRAGFRGDRRLQAAAQWLKASSWLSRRIHGDRDRFLTSSWGMTDLTVDCIQVMPPTVPASTPGQPTPTPYPRPLPMPSNQPVSGHAFGFELLVRRPLSNRLSGWLRNPVSVGSRCPLPYAAGRRRGREGASEFDSHHVLNAIVVAELGRRWRAGARFLFTPGRLTRACRERPVPPYNAFRLRPSFVWTSDWRNAGRWTERIHRVRARGSNVTLSKEVSNLV